MPSASHTESNDEVRRRAREANPDTQADVDLMILDYLACLAIDQTLYAVRNQDQAPVEDPEWMVDSIGAFHLTLTRAHGEIILPHDLEIKLRVLAVGNQLRHHAIAWSDVFHQGGPRLSRIGLEFMDLCSTAAHKVSETRWFDTGAQFLVQAVLEEQREANMPSEELPRFCSWAPGEPAKNSRWMDVRQRYIDELPDPGQPITARQVAQKFPFPEFRATVTDFLIDLMITLDPPILIQLEQGQLGDLTRDETRQLKARVGLR
ncbi:uncharacterized protein N7459_000758 [Penicillium hispanicum]|uniref:uncharacterized protein n=1 Tax=Penicillium hispanicum TaxID=1080232 RepID=UPI00254093F2|nr:uncharacterized protein N7459_000758 [Penicillium hispanicum]KAJ5594550.1 hypothetical protein N7459_000758 [Penicillium hispanicum]